jgi:hypothetical protein
MCRAREPEALGPGVAHLWEEPRSVVEVAEVLGSAVGPEAEEVFLVSNRAGDRPQGDLEGQGLVGDRREPSRLKSTSPRPNLTSLTKGVRRWQGTFRP